MAAKPNILLVHGAWSDGSRWGHVIPRLHANGYVVRAVQNPLTSLPDDIECTSKLAAALDGPTLLVGHSYGGMVITGAGHAPNVVGLVYLAAFAPDEGESVADLMALREAPSGSASIRRDADGLLWLAREGFHENLCPDLDATEALVMAVVQKPTAARCFKGTSGPAAWKSKPSWYQVSTDDCMIPPETERWFAQRMHARKMLTLQSSHFSIASHAAEVVALIEEAAAAVR